MLEKYADLYFRTVVGGDSDLLVFRTKGDRLYLSTRGIQNCVATGVYYANGSREGAAHFIADSLEHHPSLRPYYPLLEDENR